MSNVRERARAALKEWDGWLNDKGSPPSGGEWARIVRDLLAEPPATRACECGTPKSRRDAANGLYCPGCGKRIAVKWGEK